MKIKQKKWLPLAKNFRGIVFFGTYYYRGDYPLPHVVNHEQIHCAQAEDVGGWVIFYVMYFGYWLAHLFKHPDAMYEHNPFEREAKENEKYIHYLDFRESGGWRKYKCSNKNKTL